MNESIVPQDDQKVTKFSDLKVGDEVFLCLMISVMVVAQQAKL